MFKSNMINAISYFIVSALLIYFAKDNGLSPVITGAVASTIIAMFITVSCDSQTESFESEIEELKRLVQKKDEFIDDLIKNNQSVRDELYELKSKINE